MAIMKSDLFFEDGSSGWAETLYVTVPDVLGNADYDNALGKLKRLAQDRSALLAQPAYIKALRVSDTAVTKDSLLIPGEGWPRFDPTYYSDTPWQALLIRLGNTGRYWRPLYMRGIPDILFESFTLNRTTTAALSWFTLFNTWRLRVFTEGYQIRVAAKETNTAPEIGVGGYILAAGILTVTTRSPHGLAVGDTVVFYQRGFSPPLGRKQVLTVAGPDVFTVAYTGARDVTAALGRVKKIVTQYVTIDSINYERIVHRDTGRPFGLQRGRRAKKVC